jgi:hypothetical protein
MTNFIRDETERVCHHCDRLLPITEFEKIINSKTIHPFTDDRYIYHRVLCFKCYAEYRDHGTYVCAQCNIEKPSSYFYNMPCASRGHAKKCKKCVNESNRIKYRTDPAYRLKQINRVQESTKKKPEKYKSYQRYNKKKDDDNTS